MEFTSQKRNAYVGETVMFYETGRLTDIPVPAVVTAVSDVGAMLAVHQPRRSRHQVVEWSRHINDPYWEGREGLRQKNGAWDFHLIYGPLFTNGLRLEKARNAKVEQLEQEQKLTAFEFEALKALEIHGPVMSRIMEDTGMGAEQLSALTKFNEAFKAAKLQRWEQKNAKSDTGIDTEVDEGDAPGADVEFARSGKDAMTAFGLTADVWNELKANDGFPKHHPGKGWKLVELREWLSANMSEVGA